ncbi:hypothetical protein B0T16DRAFT_462045 [Cercophora newfieldiana]|uniref:Uncharacterized protein n=1 Tax=Cercophora newfieldiana TaxID=92897 RepID=A0AA39XXQ7_9PEZI|nr:hypothetical protein B0T16DRAFT_462045 [Cercophora newfieldiana]
MVRSVFAISLLGLGAVQALPANLQSRQGFVIGGPSNGAIAPGAPIGGGLPACNPDVPPEKQEACLYEPISGEMKPSPKKRHFNLIPRDSASLSSVKTAYENVVVHIGDLKLSPETWSIISDAQNVLSANDVSFTPISFSADSGFVTLTPRQDRFKIGCSDERRAELRAERDDLWSKLKHSQPGSLLYDLYELRLALTELYITFCEGEYIVGGPIVPNPTVPGGPIVPNPTVPGGPMIPNPTVPGGAIIPVPAIPGGTLKPNPTVPGGPIYPVPTVPGGKLEPAPTIPGGEMKPTRRSIESAKEKLAALEKVYGPWGSGKKIPPAVSSQISGLIAELGGQGIVVLGPPKTTIGVAP